MDQEKKKKPNKDKDEEEEKKKKKEEEEESEEDKELEKNLESDDIGAALNNDDLSEEGVGQIPDQFRQRPGE